MKRYLVKVISTGTSKNKSFAGVSKVWFEGRGAYSNIGRTIFADDINPERLDACCKLLAKSFGYESERSAKLGLASYKRHHDTETAAFGHHTFQHEIVSFEI